MDEILQYLTSVPAWYLATCVDNKPHVRPFSFATIEDEKIWFITARHKDVWEELVANPEFEACSWWPGHGWLILNGRAQEGDVSNQVRQEGYDHLTMLGEVYDGPEDPDLVFFYADGLKARIDNHDAMFNFFEL